MKFRLTKEQYDLLISLNEVSKFIYNATFENKNMYFYVYDISRFQDQIYFNIVEIGMDSEGAVNQQGRELYAIYDTLLAQISY